jgi:hypothetical protein
MFFLSSRPGRGLRVCGTHILRLEMLSVPKNMKLLAVPLFELYDNTARYGPQLSVPLPCPSPAPKPPFGLLLHFPACVPLAPFALDFWN